MEYSHSVNSHVQECVLTSVKACTLPLYVKVKVIKYILREYSHLRVGSPAMCMMEHREQEASSPLRVGSPAMYIMEQREQEASSHLRVAINKVVDLLATTSMTSEALLLVD